MFISNSWEFIKKNYLIVLIIALGGIFRFYNLNWDFQHSFHPDERNILGQTASIQASTGYRVQFFAYGQLPVYLYRATGECISPPSFVVNLFRGNPIWPQTVYWIFLLALLAGLFWFFSREKFRNAAFGISSTAILITLFLYPRFFDIFSIWFNAINDIPLKTASFVFIAVVSFGLSNLISAFMEIEWSGMPLNIALGTTVLFGIVPFILPDAFARAFGVLAFILIVFVGFNWFGWVSRWGRLLNIFLALWAMLASCPHNGPQYTGYGECMLIGRYWAAFFSTLTILGVFLFVKRVYKNSGMALVAAASFAFAVVSIENSHYCITESFITLMLMVMALLSYKIYTEGSWKNYLLTGAAFGLSMAAKTSTLYYVFIFFLGHLLLLSKKNEKEWLREGGKYGESYYSPLAYSILVALSAVLLAVGYKFKGVLQDLFPSNTSEGTNIWVLFMFIFFALALLVFFWGITKIKVLRAQIPYWIKLAASCGLSALIFCLLSPWSLLDFQGFMGSQGYEWHVVSIADACYVLQFKDTLRYLYQLQNLMGIELWWPLGITVVIGMIWVLGRFLLKLFKPVSSNGLLPVPFLKGKSFAFSLPDLMLLCWFIPYFGFIGAWNTKFVRYMVPLIPVFCIFGARFLSDFFEFINRWKFPANILKPLLTAVVLGGGLFYSIAYMHVYSSLNPWIDSSVWIYKHIPPGSAILNEAWGDGLPVDLLPQQDPRIDKPMSPGLYRSKDITPYELHGFPTDNSPVKKNYYANIFQQADYISISSKKLWYTLTDCTPEFRPHGFNAYPVTSRYYRLLWSGLLGFKMVAEFHNFPTLFGWSHPDETGEESFSVYDHPRVYLFKKFENVPPDRILKMIETDDYVKGINRDMMRQITPANVDSFIAQRRQYLQSKDLLAQLDESAPTALAAATPAGNKPLAVKPEARELEKPKEENTASPVEAISQPTPQMKVVTPVTMPGLPDAKTIRILESFTQHPYIENDVPKLPVANLNTFFYQLRAWISWLLLLILLGILALPLTLRIMSPLSSGAYSLSKVFGFLVFSWVVWFFTRVKLLHFTLGSCWAWLLVLAALSLFAYWRDRAFLKSLYAKWGSAWIRQETAFIIAFSVFTFIKLFISHIHDPVSDGYNGGGEAGMDFGFLASVVRGETFPPQNMWMAGEPIGYTFYFGHLMMGILTKTLGLAPAVTYNLALITLFALIFSCAFGLAFALSGRLSSGWIAGFLCAVAGDPAAAKQHLEALHQCFASGSWEIFFKHFPEFWAPLFNFRYDYWGPTRVIPFGNNEGSTINEFPYFSVLYGDMHAHTLAMPFAMLLIGVIASIYLSNTQGPFKWKWDWKTLVTAGFIFGAIAFLNTWEIPTWLILLGIAMMVRNLAPLAKPMLTKGMTLLFISLVSSLTLLGWWLNSGLENLARKIIGFRFELSTHALGGTTGYFVFFAILGIGFPIVWLYLKKKSQLFSKQLLGVLTALGWTLLAMALLWAPFFFADFHPQQNKVMWVKPDIRTSLWNYFNFYGLFLAILLMSFAVAYRARLFKWVGSKTRIRWKWDAFLDAVMDKGADILLPQNAVQGMFILGAFCLMSIWGASWIHWTESQDGGGTIVAQILGTLTVALISFALYLKNRWEIWAAWAALVVLWISLMSIHFLHLTQDLPPTLGLLLFSVLWLLAFFHLGLAIKVLPDRPLSFSYLLVSYFFFVTSVLEVFVMSEYFGFGNGMRNNSMFKYGINAWTLAAISGGIFLPKTFDFFKGFLKAKLKEGPLPGWILRIVSGIFVYVLLRIVLNSFLPSLHTGFVYILNLILIGGILSWLYIEEWLEEGWLRIIAISLGIVLALYNLLPLIKFGSGPVFNYIEKFGEDVSAEVLFPVMVSSIIVAVFSIYFEGRKDTGRRMVFYAWGLLLCALILMVSIYPVSSTNRKCQGFFNQFRIQSMGYAETPTLDGLSFLPRVNPYDAAAINFLNKNIPDQPCLVEFVGEGYNSWGSRYSIFTGIPALMGWDGHVREWVAGRPGMENDISHRFQATEQIFRSTDADTAKKYMDAYGVRLVMVGTVERNGVPGRKGGYPPEGLAKFQQFLPLIYKNPEVEIYYNPPPAFQ